MSKIIDPRMSIINDNLKDIGNIILVSGFKGGVGKSLVSSVLSLALSDKGYKVGLFDLDITSFTCHKILGISDVYPSEENGIIPPMVYGIYFMSFYFFSCSDGNENAVALRGDSISNAIKEVLTVTRWGKLDYLIIDMPPGFYDIAFDVMNLIKRFKVIAVKTSSPLSLDVYNRMIKLYRENGYDVFEIENMSKVEGDMKIRFDSFIDDAIGDVEKLKKTTFYSDVMRIVERII